MAALPGNPEQSRWLSLPTVAAVVLVLALVKLYVAAHVGLVFDEGYYTFWSERLAVGYLDHPPAVAVMIALGRFLAGDSELGVRLMAVVSGVAVAALLYRSGVLLLDRRTAALAVLWYNLTPAVGLGFITTPDPPSVLFWTATLWAIAEFIASRRAVWWLVAGVLAGLGLWSKYTDAFLAPGLLLLMLSSGERRQWFKLWQVWAAAGLAVLVFAPVIWWNAQHHWASFQFQGQRTETDGVGPGFFNNLGDLVAGQALYMMPILLAFAIAGIGLFAERPAAPERRGLALPVFSVLPALAYFLFHTLHARVEANWLVPLWPALSLAAASAALQLWRQHRLWAMAAISLQLVLGIAVTAVVYAQAVYQPFTLGDIDRTNETRGWTRLEARIASLAETNGARWIATSSDYAMTGELASYVLFAHSPLLVRQVNEPLRWAFLPPFDPDAAGWPALFIRIEPSPKQPQPPAEFFAQSRLAAVFRRQSGHGPLEAYSAFVVSEPTPAFYAGLKAD
jgi:4-amino-4-deoxy-L-arabinose transferase-like glycosyltransferase